MFPNGNSQSGFSRTTIVLLTLSGFTLAANEPFRELSDMIPSRELENEESVSSLDEQPPTDIEFSSDSADPLIPDLSGNAAREFEAQEKEKHPRYLELFSGDSSELEIGSQDLISGPDDHSIEKQDSLEANEPAEHLTVEQKMLQDLHKGAIDVGYSNGYSSAYVKYNPIHNKVIKAQNPETNQWNAKQMGYFAAILRR